MYSNLNKISYSEEFKLPIGVTVPSTNSIYVPTHRGGRTWMRKDSKVEKFQGILSQLISTSSFNSIKDTSKNILAVEIDITFSIRTHFADRDVDNMIKSCQDSIFETIGINDNKVMELRARKKLNTEDQDCITISLDLFSED